MLDLISASNLAVAPDRPRIGQERGLALIFTLAGLIGLVASFMSWRSKWFRNLSLSTAG